MKNDDIVIVTTVNNIELYRKTVISFPKNIDLIAIDGSKGLYGLEGFKFMFKKLKKYKYKWLIMADEDVVFVNSNGVIDLINRLENDGVTACGVRDGGLLSWRNKNPYSLNPFFCILNLEKIYAIYSEEEFLKHQYIEKDEFDDDLSSLYYPYDKESLYEGYYCFFLWLKRKKIKFTYLNAIADTFKGDLETTTVFGLDNEILLYHTWYARTYGINDYHTDRINKIILIGKIQEELKTRKIIWLTNYSFEIKKNVMKLKNKLKNKLIFFLK